MIAGLLALALITCDNNSSQQGQTRPMDHKTMFRYECAECKAQIPAASVDLPESIAMVPGPKKNEWVFVCKVHLEKEVSKAGPEWMNIIYNSKK